MAILGLIFAIGALYVAVLVGNAPPNGSRAGPRYCLSVGAERYRSESLPRQM